MMSLISKMETDLKAAKDRSIEMARQVSEAATKRRNELDDHRRELSALRDELSEIKH